MNVVFVSHCDFSGNSAMHIYSIANRLASRGFECAVAVPNDADTIKSHGHANFAVLPFAKAYDRGVSFSDRRGPDLIHAWTPRELVRKLTEELVRRYECPYIVHLEDNEQHILASEYGATAYSELLASPTAVIDAAVPEHRSHPTRYKEFIAKASGVTALIDTLLEFKPLATPGAVFWPGFDESFLGRTPAPADLRKRLGVSEDQSVVVYNGNIHASNALEVRSLFVAVQALRRSGRKIILLKTGWNYVPADGWIAEAITSGTVRDLGFLPRGDLPHLLALADVLVQPGRPNAFNDYRFPSKLPEFFATGKPVVLPRSNVGRHITDGVEGMLLERGDALEICAKTAFLLDNPGIAERIGQAGQQFALRHLMWSKSVEVVSNLYAQVLSSEAKAVHQRNVGSGPVEPGVRLVAFYLPQFHPTEENDQFWGKGFTEWTNVTQAEPNFKGHYQPQLPSDLGFYDLRLPDVLEQQAALAAQYGIHGFCYYFYWFGGRRVLDRPLDTMLRGGRPDFPFCLCWANENWTRNWDGSDEEILIEQDYSQDASDRFIRDVVPFLKDRRYICVDNAPMLLVYRVNLIPNVVDVTRRWRDICREAGIARIHLCAVQSFGIGDPAPYGFDAAVEFPPHTKRVLIDPASFPGISPSFEGYLEDYPAIVANQLSLETPAYTLYRGVMPAWDNTPRRRSKAHILVNSSPELYEHWLTELIRRASVVGHQNQRATIFINAWNEWAEGAYLEPDQKLGHARLIATRNALERGLRKQASGPPADISPVRDKEIRTRSSSPKGPTPELEDLTHRYRTYQTASLSYATVQDYCDSYDNIKTLATANGDLKDVQRPWTLKAILSTVPVGARILEIGAGEPLVGSMLQRAGYEVWIVDPYDGSGNGPLEYERFRRTYPDLHFMRRRFDDGLRAPEGIFDCIYSISVLEHIPRSSLLGVFAGLKKFLKSTGVCIHAIDHVHRGSGADEHLRNLQTVLGAFGFAEGDLPCLLARMSRDTETYYLSAEAHNRWRGSLSYPEFPMRICVSIQIVSRYDQLRLPA
jgi:glycosyltransferase involved in cell wall biosynthesis